MKKIIYVLGIIACAIVCVSCDTRDDWFKEKSSEIKFYINYPDHIDTVDAHYPTMQEITIRTEKVYGSTIETDESGFRVYREMLGQIDFIKPWRVYLDPQNPGTGDAQKFNIGSSSTHKENDYTLISGITHDEVQLFDSDTSARQLGYRYYIIVYGDLFWNEYPIRVKVNIIGNIAPIPVIAISGEGMERKIDLGNSYDKDGSVSKYEVCIDGNIIEYRKNENRYEQREGYWQSGKAAYGGTYITATSINVFNHVFQEPGKHTIYYRCLDNEGAWSTWGKETVEVRE
jgi:hypothetical protein